MRTQAEAIKLQEEKKKKEKEEEKREKKENKGRMAVLHSHHAVTRRKTPPAAIADAGKSTLSSHVMTSSVLFGTSLLLEKCKERWGHPLRHVSERHEKRHHRRCLHVVFIRAPQIDYWVTRGDICNFCGQTWTCESSSLSVNGKVEKVVSTCPYVPRRILLHRTTSIRASSASSGREPRLKEPPAPPTCQSSVSCARHVVSRNSRMQVLHPSTYYPASPRWARRC